MVHCLGARFRVTYEPSFSSPALALFTALLFWCDLSPVACWCCVLL